MTVFQKRVILAVALALALLSAGLAIYNGASRPPVAASATTPLPQCKYIVSTYGGYVAVFVTGQPVPAYITETQAAVLPAADRRMLDAGIEIFTEEELSAILEDYGS